MDTVAIPQMLHLRPNQLTAVPVKLKVAVAPDTSELAAVPPLKAATSGPRRTQAPAGLPTTAGSVSSKRWVPLGGGASTVNALLLVAVPPEVATLIGPLVAPLGTVAVIEVAEPAVKLALTPLKRTAVAPLKLVPLIVTVVPTGPLAGEKLVIVGALAVTTKPLALVAVPPGVVTRIGPLVAPLGTCARIEVAESTTNPALTVLKVTAVAPLKLVPLIVTVVPTGPLAGEKLAILGAGGALDTVTLTGSEFHRTPRISVATAVKVCEPLLVLVVFQLTE